ncbi:hypothetical protein GCM10027570_29680 [Streptomonospora sediminis]
MTRNGASRAWQTPRPAFREWRKSRPFWGGVLILLAGIVIVAAPALNPLDLIVQQGIAGVSGYFAGVLLMAVGVLVWLQPPQRFFYGIAAILLSLVSFVTSNFGGFGFGMLFGMIGGALAVAWVPDRGRPSRAPRRNRGRRRGAAGGSGAGGAAPTAEARPARGPADVGDSGDSEGSEGSGDRADAERAAETAETTREAAEGPDPGSPGGGQHRRPGSDGGGTDALPDGGRLHSLVAVAAVLALAAPAPAAASWPWDDWFGGGDEETSSPAPSPSPTTGPGSSASPAPSGGDGGGTGGAGQDGQDGAGEDSEEAPDGQDGGDGGDGGKTEPAAECTVQEGAASISKEKYRALLEACRQAKEQGKAPEFEVQQSDDRWLAHTEPSGLTADSLSMEGAAFEGVVEYPVKGGTVRYLKLSMDTAEVSGARQWSKDGGATTSMDIPEMTMSGDVVMHVTRMKLRILGIPLEFTPSFPPPLLLPSMTVTDLEADQSLAQAQTVEIPALDQQVKE